MYHIDLSDHNKDSIKSDLTKSGNKIFHDIYESKIITKLHENNCNFSGCFFCSCSLENHTPIDNRDIVEIECNGLLNNNYCEIIDKTDPNYFPGDLIVVSNEESLELAQVKSIGELVRLKRHNLGYYNEKLPTVIRKLNKEDSDKLNKNFFDEQRAVPIFKKIVEKFNLNMKLVSVHYQFDRKKLFFFYTADGRVDFRELAKELASEFKTRIELRQIGVRDEAKKLGGMGTCGREYCCISVLSSFKKITTQLANDQNLLSSMGKLSGPCGKLKCCLSFESESF